MASLDEVHERCGFAASVVRDEGQAVALCCAFAMFGDDVELAIATRPTHRRLGLARLVAQHFAGQCLRQGLTPHWDAGSPASLHLALRTGFMRPSRYNAYLKPLSGFDWQAVLEEMQA